MIKLSKEEFVDRVIKAQAEKKRKKESEITSYKIRRLEKVRRRIK